MLTEEQLAAVINGVKGVGRFILVGDPRQLPPIGAGRPFVDIVKRLRPESLESSAPPRHAPGCGELTVPRRPTRVGGQVTSQAQRRADLMLAEWFSGRKPSPAADEIWTKLEDGDVDDTLTIRRWSDSTDLRRLLLETLKRDLELESTEDSRGFEIACGGTEYEGRVYFWPGRNGKPGPARSIEEWQILSPVRRASHGVRDMNRFLQRHFRTDTLEWAKSRYRKIPKPLGDEEILWGDKVISVQNESWRKVFPAEGAHAIHRQRRHRSCRWSVQDEENKRRPLGRRSRIRRPRELHVRVPAVTLRRTRGCAARARLCLDGPQGAGQRVRPDDPRDPKSVPKPDEGAPVHGTDAAATARHAALSGRPAGAHPVRRTRALGDSDPDHEPA